MSPLSDQEVSRILRLIIIGLFGALAWVSNHLFSGRRVFPIGRFIGGILGAAIASMSVVGLLYSLPMKPSIELMFSVAGIVGWIGGDSLAKIFEVLEVKLYTVLGVEEDTHGGHSKP